ncbi:MAG: Thiol-disulfide isomerase [Parcubacteria group bacterium Gr01-1014_66]|nr:MAG: Thiol-disulfide isomerase [Parcubacteria group bacterium Gr01-1014_66]
MSVLTRAVVLIVLLLIIGGVIVVFERRDVRKNTWLSAENEVRVPGEGARIAQKTKQYERAKEISSPDGFINADGIQIADLVGKKVILIDFWTYSCINCQRTTPYLNAWYEKYKDAGLEIIGVHTPEFAFEQEYENVADAVRKFSIHYPVVLDNDYSTWKSYRNQYWPRKYLIDIDGFIIYDHIGEGAYEETEKEIQKALQERAQILGMERGMERVGVAKTSDQDTDFSKIKTPELYFGTARNRALGNGATGTAGQQTLHIPEKREPHRPYLNGVWNFADEYAENIITESRVVLTYEARRVYMVASAEKGARVRVIKNGILMREFIIDQEQLYTLIDDAAYGIHTLELVITDPGMRLFTFTFG